MTKHPLGDGSAESALGSLLATSRFSFWVSGSAQLPLSTDSAIAKGTILIFSPSAFYAALVRKRVLLCRDNEYSYSRILT